MDPPPSSEPRTRRRSLRLASIVEEALHISDSYTPEPVLATTGQGSLQSKGVAGLTEDAAFLRRRNAILRADADTAR
jgi:hypothetical protein